MPSQRSAFTRRGAWRARSIAARCPNWQAMRLSRNRQWGQPVLVDFIEKLARMPRQDGWPGLLIGAWPQRAEARW